MAADVSATELDYVQIDRKLVERAVEELDRAMKAGVKVVTAESCTGGLVATVLSEAPGAAEHLDGGFVVYTPEHKCLALGIDRGLMKKFGTVSPEVAQAMADGALRRSGAGIAIGV